MELQYWVGVLQEHLLRVMERWSRDRGRRQKHRNEPGYNQLPQGDGPKAVPASRARDEREKQRTVSATQRGQDSRHGNIWSVTWIQARADRSVAHSLVTHQVSPSGMTPTRPKTLQAAGTTIQVWEQGWQTSKSSAPRGLMRTRPFWR